MNGQGRRAIYTPGRPVPFPLDVSSSRNSAVAGGVARPSVGGSQAKQGKKKKKKSRGGSPNVELITFDTALPVNV